MKVVRIDDENLALVYLKSQLKQIPEISSVEIFMYPGAAIEYIKNNHVDVVF